MKPRTTASSTTRKLRPRATDALTVAPATVTDLTSHAVLGLEPRVFRDLLVKWNVRHAVLGRRVIASVADVLAAIDRAAVKDAADEEVVDDGEPSSVASLLARLGRRRTA